MKVRAGALHMQEKPWDAHDYIVVEICCRAVRKSTSSRRDKLSRRRVHKAFQAGAFERVEGDGVLRLKVRVGAQNVAVWKGRALWELKSRGTGLLSELRLGRVRGGRSVSAAWSPHSKAIRRSFFSGVVPAAYWDEHRAAQLCRPLRLCDLRYGAGRRRCSFP